MRILVSGSHGLVGSALVPTLQAQGQEVLTLVRSQPKGANQIYWNPEKKELEAKQLEGLDALIHLAGESVVNGRWNQGKKQRIRDSRVLGTHLLTQKILSLNRPPQTMISASAVGYYGNRDQELLDEESPPGQGFLAEVCQEWENASKPLIQKGVRLVHLRTGMVLSSKGGALKTMLPVFRAGLAGPLGNGRQFISWISLDDLISVIVFCLSNTKISGPVNAVAPQPVTNRAFAKTLGKVLRKPTVLPIPRFALHLALGEMADELLLASQFVEPKKLLDQGFSYGYPNLEDALRHALQEG